MLPRYQRGRASDLAFYSSFWLKNGTCLLRAAGAGWYQSVQQLIQHDCQAPS